MKTLVANRHCEFAGKFFPHASEIPPGTLPDQVKDKWLDWKWAREYDQSERRSLYLLFSEFAPQTEGENKPCS